MQYIRAVYVDAQTKVPATKAPTKNGPVLPISMDIAWKETTKRPTLVYGTVSDDVDTDVDGVEVIPAEEFDKYKQWFIEKEKKRLQNVVEIERSRRTYQISFTILSSNTTISVKIGEEPNKPRFTWLSRKSSRCVNKKIEGLSHNEDIKAADNEWYPMKRNDWIELGNRLDEIISSHIKAGSNHKKDIATLATLDDVRKYDTQSGYWPEQ